MMRSQDSTRARKATRLLTLLLLAVAFPGYHSASADAVAPIQGYELLWEDDFTPCRRGDRSCVNGGINTNNWLFDLGDGSSFGSFMAGKIDQLVMYDCMLHLMCTGHAMENCN